VDHRPTGGGGDGGDDDSNNSHRGPREALYRARNFLFCGLAGDQIFFLVVVILFYARQGSTHMDPRTLHQVMDWKPVPLPWILRPNTVVLLLSCLTAELARRRIFREVDVMDEWLGLGKPALSRSLGWLAATGALGMLFLAGQWWAWKQLAAQGYSFASSATPASYFFCLLSGLHALHLAAGLVCIVLCLTVLPSVGKVENRQIAIDATAWFWHVMGLTWVVLYLILRFGQ
jgi:cytochrome c oxidase subunit 3